MRQTLRTVISFFISKLIIFNCCYAQITQIKGIVTEGIKVKEGKIIIRLPDDMHAGDVISGTVVAEASGKNEKEKNQNAESLKKYKVIAGEIIIPLSETHQFIKLTITETPQPINVADGKNNVISTYPVVLSNINIINPVITTTPTHAIAGSPIRISGSFDGDASNTKCLLDGIEMKLIAESPRQSICEIPQTTSGLHTITVRENGQTTENNISAVNMDMTAPRTNLRRGEGTTIKITVSGLDGLKEPAKINIVNITPSIIKMEGGNIQQIIINPSQVAATGTYTQSLSVNSISTGNFIVNADLILPQPGSANDNSNSNISFTDPNRLCNCYINQHSYLISQQACMGLGGSLTPQPINNDQTDFPVPVSASRPVVLFPSPGAINTKTNEILLQLIAPANNVAAVIFSEKPVSGNEWNPVGYAVNYGSKWQLNWTTPLGNDGEHIIRARVAGKNNVVTEKYINTYVQSTPYSINPSPSERINLNVTDKQIRDADQKTKRITDSLRILQEKIDALQKKYDELIQQQQENTNMSEELATIDKVIDQVPGMFRDSLKRLIDSLNKLKQNLPAKVDPVALQKAADDAAQRQKDCQDRLDKLKAEKDKAQKDLDDLNKQIEGLLNQMDQLHLGNNWVGGHGYHSDGGFWYGYVGDERSNTNISAESNAIGKQLRDLKGPQNKANERVKNLNKEIADAKAECDKLKKEQEKAEQAAKNGNQHAAIETQIDEMCRQIDDLMSTLKNWCAAHPGVCNFDPELSGNPRTAAELQAYLDKLDDIIKKKQQKEKDLENEAETNGADAGSTEDEIKQAEGDKEGLENDQANAQAEADKLRTEREKQLEEERANQRKKQEEEEAKKNTPAPKPTLTEPVNPTEMQLKFQAISILRGLYRDKLIEKGPCDCETKALAFANNTNTAATDIIGGMAVGVVFAPLEAFPGLSFAAKLGLGAAKAIGSALFGGESFTDELAKNLFNVIGGEIFPKLLNSEIAGMGANAFAGKGLEEILKDEGIKATGWEGETVLKNCGKVKGKTTMLFNPNTGWVTMLIKIDNCPLIVVKYQVNKDGVPISKPTVTKVRG